VERIIGKSEIGGREVGLRGKFGIYYKKDKFRVVYKFRS
jgi:hypothetical protein